MFGFHKFVGSSPDTLADVNLFHSQFPCAISSAQRSSCKPESIRNSLPLSPSSCMRRSATPLISDVYREEYSNLILCNFLRLRIESLLFSPAPSRRIFCRRKPITRSDPFIYSYIASYRSEFSDRKIMSYFSVHSSIMRSAYLQPPIYFRVIGPMMSKCISSSGLVVTLVLLLGVALFDFEISHG